MTTTQTAPQTAPHINAVGSHSTPLAQRRFARAVELGFTKLDTYRKSRLSFIQNYVGRFYSKRSGMSIDEGEITKANPLQMIYNAVATLVPNLVYADPKIKARTNILPYRAYANTLEMAGNHLVHEIRLRNTLRKVITDSIFGVGIIKTGLGVSGQTLDIGEDELIDIGQPYAERVDLDDFTVDPLARDWEEAAFVGNRFRILKSVLMESGLYDNDKLERYGSRYDEADFKKEAESLSEEGVSAEAQELAEYIDLCEVYIPRDGIIVTLPAGRTGYGNGEFLRVVEYQGPEFGPYHMLGYAYVPNNLMPVAPCGVWLDLHTMANRVARKVSRMADRSKSILAYESSADEDAKEVAEADDGASVRVDNIDAIKEVHYGGATDDVYEYLEWTKRQFSEMSMNIDMLSGARSDAATATEAEMLNANSTVRLSDMQQIVYQFTADVCRDLLFLLHTDPLIELPLVKRVPQINPMTGVPEVAEVQVFYTPEMREGDFFDYTISVQPYSMARVDPNVKVRRILEFASTAIPAAAQAFQLLGPAFNIEGFLTTVAKEVGIDEADEIINSAALQQRVMQMMQMAGQPDGQLARMMGAPPAQTAPPLPGGGRPQQPNPMQMGPTGGIDPMAEQRQQQQAMAAELQQTY